MPATAAGAFRRTPLERSDDRVSWERSDQAFFAAGACHVLAWLCRDTYPAVNADFEDHPVERVEITSDLAAFCDEHHHRMPCQYWQDPLPRARAYVVRCPPPWA